MCTCVYIHICTYVYPYISGVPRPEHWGKNSVRSPSAGETRGSILVVHVKNTVQGSSLGWILYIYISLLTGAPIKAWWSRSC